MDLYLLDKQFQRLDVVDDFDSVIWTERYDKAGDVALVVPLTKANTKKYPEGLFLSTPDSNEVMILESVYKDDDAGTLKCTGPTLTGALNNRYLRTSDTDSTNQNWVMSHLVRLSVLEMINRVVSEVCIAEGDYTDNGINVIPNLTLDPPLTSTWLTPHPWAVPWGTVYEVIAQLAQTYGVGFKLYLESVTDTGYSLKFLSYNGRDLYQFGSPLEADKVLFSSEMDTLAHIKELHSIADYKNFVVTYTSGTVQPERPGFAFIDNNFGHWSTWHGRPIRLFEGIDLRRLDVVVDDLSNFSGDPGDLARILDQKAQTILTKHNESAKVVDGEIVPNSQMKYGRDYQLGDIVGLEALDGDASPARVTEYIRTQDNSGAREYPTISVIGPNPST